MYSMYYLLLRGWSPLPTYTEYTTKYMLMYSMYYLGMREWSPLPRYTEYTPRYMFMYSLLNLKSFYR